MRDVAILTSTFADWVEFVNSRGLHTFGLREVEKDLTRYCLVQNMDDARRHHFHSKIEREPCWSRELWDEVDRRIAFDRELREGKRWD